MTGFAHAYTDYPVDRVTHASRRVHVGPAWPLARLGRAAFLLTAGALPVSAIPVYVLGWLPMTYAAAFFSVPAGVVAATIMVGGSAEGAWALRGFAAGLLAVLAYDSVRMPLVWTNVWPDFIPRLGAWIVGDAGPNAFVGYTWRYLGDGGGMGLSYFVVCSVVLSLRPQLLTARPVLASVATGCSSGPV